jgi:hypothetical protein
VSCWSAIRKLNGFAVNLTGKRAFRQGADAQHSIAQCRLLVQVDCKYSAVLRDLSAPCSSFRVVRCPGAICVSRRDLNWFIFFAAKMSPACRELGTQHVLEMFRRTLPDNAVRRSLGRVSNRLTKMLAEMRTLNTLPK